MMKNDVAMVAAVVAGGTDPAFVSVVYPTDDITVVSIAVVAVVAISASNLVI